MGKGKRKQWVLILKKKKNTGLIFNFLNYKSNIEVDKELNLVLKTNSYCTMLYIKTIMSIALL